MTTKFLVVKLDQYAGNVDEIVCVALTGSGMERYGGKQAQLVFNEKLRPLLDSDDEYAELPIDFMEFPTDHGTAPYELDGSSTNSLRFGIDDYSDIESINETIALWKLAYGQPDGEVTIEVPGVHDKPVTVKVLGFELIEVKETRTTL